MGFDLEGSSVSPESVARELHKAMAQSLCDHADTYCDHCYNRTYDLVKPIARAIMMAAMFERQNRNAGFVGIGQAVDIILKAAKASKPS